MSRLEESNGMSLFPQKPGRSRRVRDYFTSFSEFFIRGTFRATSWELKRLAWLALLAFVIGLSLDIVSTVLFTTKCGWWTEGSVYRYVLQTSGIRGFLFQIVEGNLPLILIPLLTLILLPRIMRHDTASYVLVPALILIVMVGIIHFMVVPVNLVFWSQCYPWGFNG
jgi:hypothetical protein